MWMLWVPVQKDGRAGELFSKQDGRLGCVCGVRGKPVQKAK